MFVEPAYTNWRIYLIDPNSGDLLNTIVYNREMKLRWIDGWPYFDTGGTWQRWDEEDPRLEAVTAGEAVLGVGDFIDIDVTAKETTPNAELLFFFDPSSLLNDGDEVILGRLSWASGTEVSENSRRFTLALPPTLEPGDFRVGASLVLPPGSRDSNRLNNACRTIDAPVNVPGFALAITQTGEGTVDANDERPFYPLGAKVSIFAAPGEGHSFAGWSGSLTSASPGFELEMTEDVDLSVMFMPGWRTSVKAVGGGTISGGNDLMVLADQQAISLRGVPMEGWAFSHWQVNGVTHHESDYSHQATSDSTIIGIFVPDLEFLKNEAFQGSDASLDRSWSGDPDRDGVDTFLEVLLRSSPVESDSAVAVEAMSDSLRLRFRRPQSMDEPYLKPEFSTDLVHWAELPESATSRVVSIRDGFETVEVIVPFPISSQGYLRLASPSPPPEMTQ